MGSQCGLLAGFGSRVSALHPCRADRRGGAGHRRPPRGGCRACRRGGNAAGARLVLLSPQLLCRGRRAAARRAAGGMSGGAAAGAALLALALAAAGEAAVVLRDGGYEGLLAAVHPRVPEDGRLVAHLQVRRKAAGPGRGSPVASRCPPAALLPSPGGGTGPDAYF